MSLVETYHRAHLEREARIEAKAFVPKAAESVSKPMPPPLTVPPAHKAFDYDYEFAWHLAMLDTEIQILDRPRKITIERIQIATSNFYSISRLDLLSSRRTANLVRPRQVAMYLAKVLTLGSLPQIGRKFAGRDHTTVLHAVRKIEELILVDPKLAGEVHIIKGQLQPEAFR